MTQNEKHLLEAMMDRHSLMDVVAELRNISYEKEGHVAEAWGDRGLASAWARAGKALDACVGRLHKIRVPGITS